MCGLNKIWLVVVIACQINSLVGSESQQRVMFNARVAAKSVAQFNIRNFLNSCASNDYEKQRRIYDFSKNSELGKWIYGSVYREVPAIDRPSCMLIDQLNKKYDSGYSGLFLRDLVLSNKLHAPRFGAACGASDDCSSQTISPKSADFKDIAISDDLASCTQDLESIIAKNKSYIVPKDALSYDAWRARQNKKLAE